MKNKFDLKEKIVVVVGGAGLIGKALVEGLRDHNATVISADIKDCDFIFDITDTKRIDVKLKELKDIHGRIDVLVNVSYPRSKDYGAILEKESDVSWKENVDLHLNSYCLLSKKAAMIMKSGSIINYASIYGAVAPDFSIYDNMAPSPGVYSAVKAGIISFTRYLASYYGSKGIRANTICPGGIFNNQPKEFVKKYSDKTPLKRMGTTDDLIGATVFLASDASAYITGTSIYVDGGWTAL